MPQNERQNGITERKFSSYENLLHRYILASYRSRNKGLLYGQLGSAIILYSIARNPRFSAVEPTADDLLDKALKDLPDNLPIGLATGLTGYCWGVEYLTYKQYIECIPNEVCESLILNIQKSRQYDVLSENEMKRVIGGSDSGSGSDIDKCIGLIYYTCYEGSENELFYTRLCASSERVAKSGYCCMEGRSKDCIDKVICTTE